MILLVTYFFAAIILSFLCSLLESVILSVTPAYIQLLMQSKRRSGALLLELTKEIDKPLSAILTVNTLANTLGATGVGAQVLKVYGDGYVAIASGTLTLSVLIFSEIIPKTLGAVHWKKLAPTCSYIIRSLITALYPFVQLSKFISKILSAKRDNTTTREEMIATAQLGANDGVIRKKESKVIKNLLLLDTIPISEVMTPRSVLTAYESHTTVDQIMEQYRPIRFSRIPVYDKNLDNVVGLLHRYKLMEAVSNDLDGMKIFDLITPIHTVNESLSVSAALDKFIKRKEHLFLVVDDNGKTQGIVTLEDTIETLLGVEIVDETDSVEDMRAYATSLHQQRKGK